MCGRIEHSATLQSFCCHAASLRRLIAFRSPVLAKACAFLVWRRRTRSSVRAIFAQRKPTRDKPRAARAATFVHKGRTYELPNHLRHGSGGRTLPAHHLGMPPASRVVAANFLKRKGENMEYLVVLGTALMIAGYAFIIGRALRELEHK